MQGESDVSNLELGNEGKQLVTVAVRVTVQALENTVFAICILPRMGRRRLFWKVMTVDGRSLDAGRIGHYQAEAW